MLDRADYALSDFLLFSARVYYRMLELHNAALWPIHVFALIIGVFLVVIALRPSSKRIRLAFVLLALIWLFVAWAFFLERYATINWAAVYIAPVFVLQALLLGFIAVRQKKPELVSASSIRGALAIAVLAFSLIATLIMPAAFDRSWQTVEIFAIAPDPTVIATLAMLTMRRGTLIALAAIVPLFWITLSSLTLYTLGSVEYVVWPIATLVCGIAVYFRT